MSNKEKMAWAWASTCTERMVICLRQCSQTASGSRVSQLRCQFYVDVLFLKYQHPDVDCRSPWFPWFMVSLTKRTRCRVYVARWAVDLRAKARHSIHPRADSHDRLSDDHPAGPFRVRASCPDTRMSSSSSRIGRGTWGSPSHCSPDRGSGA